MPLAKQLQTGTRRPRPADDRRRTLGSPSGQASTEAAELRQRQEFELLERSRERNLTQGDTQMSQAEFSNQLLRGAAAIAKFLFGDVKFRRRVYHLATTSRRIPVCKIGSMWCSTTSALTNWVQEEIAKRTKSP